MADRDPQLRNQLQKKVARSLIRLRHSLAADVEVYDTLRQLAEVGTQGTWPQIETTLSEILNED